MDIVDIVDIVDFVDIVDIVDVVDIVDGVTDCSHKDPDHVSDIVDGGVKRDMNQHF